MFEATFVDAFVFKQTIDSMKDLISEANFDCTKTGISVQAMESSHISLVSLTIGLDAFKEYRCDRNIVLGLNILSLSKILKCLESEDKLMLTSKEDDDIITLSITSKNENKKSCFELKLMNIDAEKLTIPDQDADVDIVIPSSKCTQIFRDLLNFGDTVRISATKSSVQFIADGTLGSANITLQQTECSGETDSGYVKIDFTQAVDQSYSLKFLSMFSKAACLCKEVFIHLTNESPLCLEYRLSEGECGVMKYYLAPKLKDNEEEK